MTTHAKKRRRAESMPGGYVRLPNGTTWPSPLLALREAKTSGEARLAAAYFALADAYPKRLRYVLRHLREHDRRERWEETP